MKKSKYNFENIYIINTYSCNCNCDFCLCKYQKSKIDNLKILKNLKMLLFKRRMAYKKGEDLKKIYIKITGGEPFLNSDLIKEVINISDDNVIYKIGIGTNGTIQLPEYLNYCGSKLAIFLSRHHYDENEQKNGFKIKNNLNLDYIIKNINDKIQISCNCNLIKNEIDSYKKIIKYLDWAIEKKLYSVTFRELNKLCIKNKYQYENYIYNYLKFYKYNLIRIKNIYRKFMRSKNFNLTRYNGNYYDTNYWFYYYKNNNKISVKLRLVDEKKLFKYNLKNNFDEYTIIPNGKLLKSWQDQ